MPVFIKNMIYNFAKDVQQLLGTDLSRLLYMAHMQEAIIQKIQM